jgi:hypothetical protein
LAPNNRPKSRKASLRRTEGLGQTHFYADQRAPKSMPKPSSRPLHRWIPKNIEKHSKTSPQEAKKCPKNTPTSPKMHPTDPRWSKLAPKSQTFVPIIFGRGFGIEKVMLEGPLEGRSTAEAGPVSS